MALSDFALTTLATVKTELGISVSTYDSVLERMIHAVSDEIRRVANRDFHYEANISEKIAGFGGPHLVLSRVPVVAVDEVVLLSVSGSVTSSIADTSYQVDTAVGTLTNPSGWEWTAPAAVGIPPDQAVGWERKAYRITYDAGYVTPAQAGTRTLPYDLEQAAIESVVSLYRSRSRQYDVASESYPETSVTYGNNGTQRGLLTERAYQIARRYYRSTRG